VAQSQYKRLQKEISDLMIESGWGSEAAQKIVEFDLFDQMAYAEWFDAEWMLGVKNGFDVVIGNPPYIRADNPEIAELRRAILSSKDYQSLWEKWDIYVAFLERGYQLLNRKGKLSFIIPDAYMASKYALKSHHYFLKNSVVERIDFCSKVKIFEAEVRNIIILFSRQINPDSSPKRILRVDTFENSSELQPVKQSELGVKCFTLAKTASQEIVLTNTINWEGVCYVSKGMVLQSDENNFQNEFKKKDLIVDTYDKYHTGNMLRQSGSKDIV
jgi:adenine-specific DNA-methyltransferase